MNIDELKGQWRADAPNGVLHGRTEAEMLDDVKNRMRKLDRRIRFRDTLETLAALAVILIFATALPSLGWIARVGAIIVMAACVFIAWRLTATRRRHAGVGGDRPVSEMLRAEIRETDDQIGLLRSVLWWYVSPIAVGVVLVVAGVRGLSWFTLGYAVAVALLGAGIHYLNQYCVRRDLLPRRRELESELAAIEMQGDDR